MFIIRNVRISCDERYGDDIITILEDLKVLFKIRGRHMSVYEKSTRKTTKHDWIEIEVELWDDDQFDNLKARLEELERFDRKPIELYL